MLAVGRVVLPAFGGAVVIHGTISTYSNHHCRCRECKTARAAYARNHRARTALGLPFRRYNDPDRPLEHGTPNAYSYHHCRCAACFTAHSERMRVYRAKRKAAA